MSNVLAIAAVTQILKDLINDAMIQGDLSQALGADFDVTALPPDQVVAESGAEQPTQLNLFLYRISPNAALRNADLPTRSRAGEITCRPRLALDLHYILTAVSSEEMHAEILLGYAMQLFHEQAILGRETIRTALQATPLDEILPEAYDIIRAAELADQIELLKITPRTLTMDDMSKLWTAFQASYRTTVAYDVSLVLIERELPARPALPVLSRGGLVDPATGRDPGVSLRPNLASPVPTIEAIRPVDGHPVMRLGGQVELTGFALDGGLPGAEITVRFAEPGTGVVQAMAPLSPVSPNRLVVQLPAPAPLPEGSPAAGGAQDPLSWRIGNYIVDIELRQPPQSPGLAPREIASNALPLALAPLAGPSIAAAPSPEITLAFTVAPPIRAGQAVALLAGQDMAVLERPLAPLGDVSAPFTGFATGDEIPVRLRVDGIDSPVIDLTADPPRLTTVTVP